MNTAAPRPERADELDRDLETLHAKRTEWARLPLSEKIALLERVLACIGEAAAGQAADAIKAKGIPEGSPQRGEEWLGGPMVQARVTRQLIEALRALKAHGHTGVTARHARRLPSGQVAVRVFPNDLIDKVSFVGFSAELWLTPEASTDDWHRRTSSFNRPGGADEGGVALVLGAGNVASIGLLDALHKLVVEGRVCFLKFNPVNDYLEPHYARALRPLIAGRRRGRTCASTPSWRRFTSPVATRPTTPSYTAWARRARRARSAMSPCATSGSPASSAT